MKNDYKRNYFWTSKNEETGEMKYYFNLNNTKIEVSKEVYYTCFNSYRKLLRDMSRDDQYGVIYLSSLNREEYDEQFNNENTLIDMIYKKEKVASIMKMISELNESDREIITNLLLYNKSERELAKQLGISHTTVHRRKEKILKEIKKDEK